MNRFNSILIIFLHYISDFDLKAPHGCCLESDATVRDDAICLFSCQLGWKERRQSTEKDPAKRDPYPDQFLVEVMRLGWSPLLFPERLFAVLRCIILISSKSLPLIRLDTNNPSYYGQRTPCSDVCPVTRALSGISLKTWRIWRVRFLQRRQVGESNEPLQSNLLMRPPPRSDT